MSDADDYLNIVEGARLSVPAYERMKQLHAYGWTDSQILETLHQEFQDIDHNPINKRTLEKIYTDNKEEFKRARMELGLKCREDIQRQTALLLKETQNTELLLVQTYNRQLRSVLEEMAEINLQEKDEETGNYKSTSRMFVLLEFSDKLVTKMGAITGSAALREIEIFRAKAEAKRDAEQKGSGLIPAHGLRIFAHGRTSITEQRRREDSNGPKNSSSNTIEATGIRV